jgi:hypothetical protein
MPLTDPKYFVLHCLEAGATFPSKKGRYLGDIRSITFLNLLKSRSGDSYRMCYICRTYRPINSELLNQSAEDKNPGEETSLDVQLGTCPTNEVKNLRAWKDEDWTFLSLGKCVSKHGVIETRTYCPRCVLDIGNINIRKRSKRTSLDGGREEVMVARLETGTSQC